MSSQPIILALAIQDRASKQMTRALFPLLDNNPEAIKTLALDFASFLSGNAPIDRGYFRHRFNYWAVWKEDEIKY